jgi:hypothetical protein
MTPQPGSKYGFFATLADVDGREATIALAGVEGMFALSDRMFLETRGGIGMAWPNNIDFVTADARLDYVLSESSSVHASLALSEFDETVLRAVGYDANVGLSYGPVSLPVTFNAELGVTGLTGRDSADAEPYAKIGMVWRFGTQRSAARPVRERSFNLSRPFDPLLRRGRF